MKVHLRTDYFKRRRPGKSPAVYHARQPRGKGTVVHARVHLDPSLRDKPDLRRLVLQHEQREIRAWGNGMTVKRADKVARKGTRRDDHFDSASEYWRLIRRREKRK